MLPESCVEPVCQLIHLIFALMVRMMFYNLMWNIKFSIGFVVIELVFFGVACRVQLLAELASGMARAPGRYELGSTYGVFHIYLRTIKRSSILGISCFPLP